LSDAVEAAAPLTVLVVDDDVAFAERLATRHFAGWRASVRHSVESALQMVLEGAAYDAAVIDFFLPDGLGLEVVSALRLRSDCPIMVLTNYFDRDVVNRIHSLGAEYVLKIDHDINLKVFRERAARTLVRHSGGVEAFARASGLSQRETEILLLAVREHSRDEIASLLGLSEETVKSHTRSILRKCGEQRLQDVARRIRRAGRGQP